MFCLLPLCLLLAAVPRFAQDATDSDHRSRARVQQRVTRRSPTSPTTSVRGSPDRGMRAIAVKCTTERFREWGIDVHDEKVMVPHWVRGEERAPLVSHNNQKIVLTALGGSVATPAAGHHRGRRRSRLVR